MVIKLDRLGRSLEHLIELSKLLQVRGVDLVVIDQGIDTSTPRGPQPGGGLIATQARSS
ncbi:MAG: recombinase family protein [Actinomycetota bacterium]|nr:recombinase family protein [Actinomycetota bacterium]